MSDILIFFVIAVFLIVRLLKILGTSNESVKKDDYGNNILDYFLKEFAKKKDGDGTNVFQQEKDKNQSWQAGEKFVEAEVISVVEAGLSHEVQKIFKKISELETFNIEDFVKKAEKAYEFILNEMFRNDIKNITSFLSDNAIDFLQKKRSRYDKNSFVVEQSLIKLISADIVGAELHYEEKDSNEQLPIATILVDFKSHQTYVVRDGNGNLVDGSESKMYTVVETWKFTKKLGQNNAKIWIVDSIEQKI